MHPWFTARMATDLQADRVRAASSSASSAHLHAHATPIPNRRRLGLIIARLGERLAGARPARSDEEIPWTTCSASRSIP